MMLIIIIMQVNTDERNENITDDGGWSNLD